MKEVSFMFLANMFCLFEWLASYFFFTVQVYAFSFQHMLYLLFIISHLQTFFFRNAQFTI